MQVIKKEKVIFFDVDGTLGLWDYPPEDEHKAITILNNKICHKKLVPHEGNIEALKRHHQQGHITTVWSAGGSEWAEAVVRSFGLENYVDLVISKPELYYDDLDAAVFLKHRRRFGKW